MEKVGSPFYVVGIGASAGGLRALEEFFENMPPDSGAAFVVIQHLSPDFKSMMDELLERRTSMAVHLATNALALEPNSVYLIPPGKNLVVRDRHLHLSEQDRHLHDKQPYFPIDIFFHALAQDCQIRAIAVVLSGTGRDGSYGLTAIHEQGGVAMVQDPVTAEFNGMPQNALQTGVVDRVLAPCDLAQVIYDFVRSPLERLQASGTSEENDGLEDIVDSRSLQQITKLLAENSHVDFSHYKTSTLCRRIQRRFLLAGHSSLAAYIQHLQLSEQERNTLRSDLLISVTRFFRDPAAWEFLEAEILPPLFEQAPDNAQLRFWVTACATGEEAYSLAMLLDEARQKLNPSARIKIFATDIDTHALERASLGRYPSSIASDMSEDRLQKYFLAREDGYEVTRQLRKMMIFSEHNMIRDAMFTRMNLVSCRNVLIYMQPSLQRQVLQGLHFALAPKGTLFLGESETLGNLSSEFRTLHKHWKIFEKIRDVRLSMAIGRADSHRSGLAPYFFSSTSGKQPQFDPLLETAFKEFATQRQVTCLLVDRNNQLLHVVADALGLLQVPLGRVTYDALQLLPDPLRLPLNTALRRAIQVADTVEFADIRLDEVHESQSVHLQAKLYQPGAMSRDFLLVTIQAQESISRLQTLAPVFQADDAVASHVMQLEWELQQTRENLQATIEELETTNEEQQASNEELIASNEELQSTNEELHSVNEELHTVNAEYQSKIQDLTELNADLDNLLQNTQVGVIFLDPDLKVRKFTASVSPIIKLRNSDIGRSLQELFINIDLPDLIHLIREVEHQQHSISREVKLADAESHFMVQIHPYQMGTDNPQGTVLTFVDITQIKQAEAQVKAANAVLEERVAERTQELQQINNRYELIFAGSKAGLLYWDVANDQAEISPRCAEILGYDPQQTKIISFAEFNAIVHPDDLARVEGAIASHLDAKNPYDIEYRVRHQAGHDIWLHVTGQTVWDESDRPTYMGLSMQDISDRKQAETALRANQAEYETVFNVPGAGMWTWDILTERMKVSARYKQILGYQPDAEIVTSFTDFTKLMHPDDKPVVEATIKQHLNRQGSFAMEYRLQHKEGHYIWIGADGQAMWDEGSEPVFMAGTLQDISDRKHQEAQLQETIIQLEEATRSKDEFLANMSHELRTPLNAILGISEAMQESLFGSVSNQQKQMLETIYESGSHLLSLINDILDTAKIGAGKFDLEFSQCNIRHLCQSSFRLVQQQALQKKLQFEIQLPGHLPILYIDERRIRQALLNFLSNAVKFTPTQGAVYLKAEVLPPAEPQDAASAEPITGPFIADQPILGQSMGDQSILRISVTDTGIGISPENQTKLFEPFCQVDSKFNRQHNGTGLGLCLTRQIVELHQGTVGLTSEPGEGSCFWMDLPFDEDTVLVEEDTTDDSDLLVNLSPDRNNRPLILLVEDNPGNIVTLGSYLKAKGYRMIFAGNGRDGIVQARSGNPDIILMDIQMPVMDGLDAIRQIRQIPEFVTTPIIALTALAMEDDKEKCLAAGANDYMSKPVKLKQLAYKIQQLTLTHNRSLLEESTND